MKNFLTILLITITLFSLGAITSKAYYEEEEARIADSSDLSDGIYAESFSSDFIDPVLTSSVENEGVYINDPLETSNDSNVSLFNIINTSEDTDITFDLEGLVLEQFLSESDGTSFKNIINIDGETLQNRSNIYNKLGNHFTFTDNRNIYINMQGSCSDGKYVYYIFYVAEQITDDTRVPIGLCILSGFFDENDTFVEKEIVYSSDLVAPNCLSSADELKHGNDITYNELRDELVIVCCQDGYHNLVYSFDAAYFRGDTKDIPDAERHELSCMISNMAYNSKYNKYVGGVLGDTDYFVFFDSDFNIIGKFNEKTNLSNNAGRQAIYCDDNYIYATYKISGTANTDITIENVICIYDWSGQLVKEINLDIDRVTYNGSRGFYEIEGITMINDKVLIGFNCYFRNTTDNRVAYFYQYDLAPEFFSVKYCADNNIENYINNTDVKTQNIIHGFSTKTLENTYRKNGYKFIGWNVYSVNTGKWRYHNSSTNTWRWYSEGSQPSGFEKAVYPECGRVSQTVSAGNQALFCAVWEETDKFYVSFNSNNGSGTMNNLTVTHGTSTPLPANSFSKGDATFKGWNAYAVEIGKWYYYNVSTGDRGWYIEGEQPDGYMKYVYSEQANIKQTVSKGSHVIFYAQWNEFVIFYDAGGRLISKNAIKTPTVVISGISTKVDKYTLESIAGKDSIVHQPATNFDGYYQHRSEKGLWRYADENNLNPYWSVSSTDELYVFEGTNVSKTGAFGEHIVFVAKWS